MSEVILFLVIAALLAYIGWKDYQDRKEKKEWMKVLIAKNATELTNLELAEKVDIQPQVQQFPTDFVPESELSDRDFEQVVLGKEEDNGRFS